MVIKDSYTACGIVEGFDVPDNVTVKDELKAWAYLIKTKQYLCLQGWYGRTGTELIRSGYISETGRINWRFIKANTELEV